MSGEFKRASTKRPTLKANARPWVLMGLFWIVAIFGVLGGWAYTAPISSAVIAQGTITVDGKRKTIQHLEGGIVKTLPVTDGDVVEPGQTLVELDPTRARASLAIIDTSLDQDMAMQARLIAERDSAESVTYPPELLKRADDPDIAQLIQSQNRIFKARREALKGEVEILKQRVGQLGEEVKGLKAQQEAKEQQIKLISEELEGLQKLLEKGQTTRPRMLALQRSASALEGERGELIANIARAKKSVGETQLQIIQRERDFHRSVSEELQTVEARLRDLRERAIAARDVLDRITITAPLGGTVVNMSVHTIGAVIRPGDTVMEIVPGRKNLIVDVRV